MSKVRITFKNAHGLYNGGETAGFDAATAAAFIAQGVAAPFDEKAQKQAEAAQAGAADLADREAELAAREAALTEREAALAGSGAAEAAKGVAAEKGADGAPPKQGAKA